MEKINGCKWLKCDYNWCGEWLTRDYNWQNETKLQKRDRISIKKWYQNDITIAIKYKNMKLKPRNGNCMICIYIGRKS